ncbi:hypothetical protein SAMN04488503_2216 [Humidesulfovibrio mexicanus]|uniref:Uncharacterized protein n=1 Tax=Humidesulfovibrio mexicanus TaxID=147047 RepID=A0A239AU12_9BACT|nr:hypothetical protein [Humidesulfovibrio mexicanus]SNR99019.1 hypothetical protein SAMN04488503_2216 [Humidesulfovibrio mexicanus]
MSGMFVTVAEARKTPCPFAKAKSGAFCTPEGCKRWAFGPQDMQPSFGGYGTHPCDDPRAVVEPARPACVPASWEWCPADWAGDALWAEPRMEFCGRFVGRCGRKGKRDAA